MGEKEDEQTAQRSGEEYEPPAIRCLGTLAELTRGGALGPPDGNGGAGDIGSIPSG